MTTIDRRSFLRNSAVAGGAAAVSAGPLSALLARAAGAQPGGRAVGSRAGTKDGGYGPLVDMGELWLPEGFRYVAFGRQGSELPLTRGGLPAGILPRGHDGMASFATAGAGLVRLVRNHENRSQTSPLGGAGYDPARFGGTTTMEFDVTDPADADRDADRFRGQWVSIQGTSTNCAGGPTPWGSWMTCEETVETVGETPHGYIFDVPAAADGPVEPLPLKAMGRFVHEAVAIDPRTNMAYETEDRRINGPGTGSGFYRFTPFGTGPYGTDGLLEMLVVQGRPNHDTSTGQRVGEVLPVTWVPIANPDPGDATANSQAVFQQGWEQGGAVFNRLEGAWYGDGSIFFISTNGGDPAPMGDPGLGQVWQYIPEGNSGGQLVLLVESRDPAVMEAPDNITVSPRGGLLCCEDGEADQFLRGVTPDGRVFDFATHNLSGSNEFAGANWSPDGNWLFVNVQEPGTTFAITGPWETGTL
ncbi:MAG TPA: alkaline phosphatase PhoX [Acidimicrobiales bacterium]|nr:alkaline phosphatase PhoX [Acidimicrobiales bacterium]